MCQYYGRLIDNQVGDCLVTKNIIDLNNTFSRNCVFGSEIISFTCTFIITCFN